MNSVLCVIPISSLAWGTIQSAQHSSTILDCLQSETGMFAFITNIQKDLESTFDGSQCGAIELLGSGKMFRLSLNCDNSHHWHSHSELSQTKFQILDSIFQDNSTIYYRGFAMYVQTNALCRFQRISTPFQAISNKKCRAKSLLMMSSNWLRAVVK